MPFLKSPVNLVLTGLFSYSHIMKNGLGSWQLMSLDSNLVTKLEPFRSSRYLRKNYRSM